VTTITTLPTPPALTHSVITQPTTIPSSKLQREPETDESDIQQILETTGFSDNKFFILMQNTRWLAQKKHQEATHFMML